MSISGGDGGWLIKLWYSHTMEYYETPPTPKESRSEFMELVRLPIKHFICNILFRLHNNSMKFPFYRWGPWDLSKVTRLVNGVTMIRFEFYGPQIHFLIQLHSISS